jgi:hypothetical protein
MKEGLREHYEMDPPRPAGLGESLIARSDFTSPLIRVAWVCINRCRSLPDPGATMYGTKDQYRDSDRNWFFLQPRSVDALDFLRARSLPGKNQSRYNQTRTGLAWL